MLSTTHIVVGMAAAVTACRPESAASLLPVLAFGAAGSLFCDLDRRTKPGLGDAVFARLMAALILIIILTVDDRMGSPLAAYLDHVTQKFWTALLVFLICAIFAGLSGHRGFSHSLLALAVCTGSLYVMAGPDLSLAFGAAFLSHILLDLTNRKPVRVFYPFGKGHCLGWFYADRKANTLCLILGAGWLSLALAWIRPEGLL